MRPYFKGYYFKCCTSDKTIALIPAMHKEGKEYKASLQIITNDNTYSVPYSEIRFGRNKFRIKIGSNVFSEKGMRLAVDTKDCKIHGTVIFGPFQKLSYSIMGPFEYVPFMQCKHTIISMRHTINGTITINDCEYLFKNHVGYIEGDSGFSFPKNYIWTQCQSPKGSIMLSVADIPILGFHFTGIIGVISLAGKQYRVATYLGAKVVQIYDNLVVLKQGNYTLSVKLIETRHQKLKAPVNGNMLRTIQESASCKAWYQLKDKNRILLEFISDNASFEYEWKKHTHSSPSWK